jgi:ankyrin repeat protein
MPQRIPAPSLEYLKTAPIDEIFKALSTLLRFGRFEALEPILKQLQEEKSKEDIVYLLRRFDAGGHSLLHWASKRVDDSRFINKVVELIVEQNVMDLMNAASGDNVGMRPLHWACTEGSIPHVALLLKNGADMEAKDNSGCTPLLIAAQYGQVEVVAYLLKNGSNIQAVDTSRDTALHWAAYKGSIQVCGLLSYYQKLDWSTQDAYGQTPIHLASLRGHTTVVRYILNNLRSKEVLFQKDKNERSPLDLAIHKSRPNVEKILKEAMMVAKDPRGHFLRQTLLTSAKDLFTVKTWKSWLGLTAGMDEMDVPSRFPYYFMLINFFIHFIILATVFAPIASPGKGIMWDKSGWLMWNFLATLLSWYFFYKTVTANPGYIDDSLPSIGRWRQLYDETLEAYADATKVQNIDLVCLSCGFD